MAFTFAKHADDGYLLATDPLTQRTELVQLASHRKAEVRGAVAARRDCPMATMFALIHDEQADVLEALALNPSSPRAVLEALAAHRKESVRLLAVRRLRYMGVAA